MACMLIVKPSTHPMIISNAFPTSFGCRKCVDWLLAMFPVVVLADRVLVGC